MEMWWCADFRWSFNHGQIGGNDCAGALTIVDLNKPRDVWLFGDMWVSGRLGMHISHTVPHSFMKNICTAFSVDQNPVGFATSA